MAFISLKRVIRFFTPLFTDIIFYHIFVVLVSGGGWGDGAS